MRVCAEYIPFVKSENLVSFMKKYVLFLMMMLSVQMAVAQGMSDQQVINFVAAESKAGTSQAQIITKLMQRGVKMDQIRRLRQQYDKQISSAGQGAIADGAVNEAVNRMRKNNEEQRTTRLSRDPREVDVMRDSRNARMMNDSIMLIDDEPEETTGKKVFGRDIFNKRALTFEPQMNIATPQNYVLGPGDEVVVDIYGASQKSETLTVSPDGTIVVPDYGPISVSGLTVAAAQTKLRKTLGSQYASSNLQLTVGQTRTIMVNVMGEVKVPGTYTLSAFSTVFHALYMAGGISDLGTLRNVKVYRNGKLVTVVDIYEYILNGRLAGNIRLHDNDVIQVGTYESIVDIAGRVKRPMAYELRKNESLSTLMKFSGGFASDAYKKSLRVLRKNGRMKSVFNVQEFDVSSFKMFDGDSVTVDSIIDRFENMVEVKGSVFRPGMYNLGDQVSSVRTLIEAADGLTEEAMVSRAVIRRMKPNRTQEVLSVDLKGIMDGTVADVPLENEDLLFIPTLAERQNLRTLSIDGEVIFPGIYEYADNTTIEDLILQAGGLTDNASTVKVDVARRVLDPSATTATMEVAKTFSFSVKPGFELDGNRSFTLMPYDAVSVRRSPMSAEPLKVSIEGEIAFAGAYTLEQKNQRLSDVVKAAGGVIPGAYVRGARLVRVMNEAERARLEEAIKMAKQTAAGSSKDSLNLEQLATETTYLVGIHLDEALAHPGSDEDVELQEGDRIIIPRVNHTVKISGDILKPNTVAFKSKKGYKYYVEQAGGYGRRARKGSTYILYQNGTIAKASKAKVEPGCEIIVPTKGPRDAAGLTQWLSIGTSAASLATMFISVANMLK